MVMIKVDLRVFSNTEIKFFDSHFTETKEKTTVLLTPVFLHILKKNEVEMPSYQKIYVHICKYKLYLDHSTESTHTFL